MNIHKNIRRISLYKKFSKKLLKCMIISFIILTAFLVANIAVRLAFALDLLLAATSIFGLAYIIAFINTACLKAASFDYLAKQMPLKEELGNLKDDISSLEKARLEEETRSQLESKTKAENISATKQLIKFGDKTFICELRKVAVKGNKFTEKVFCKEITPS